MATAAAIAFSALTSKSVRVSLDIKDLYSSKVNVVHVQRPQLTVPDHPSKLLSTAGLQVCWSVHNEQQFTLEQH